MLRRLAISRRRKQSAENAISSCACAQEIPSRSELCEADWLAHVDTKIGTNGIPAPGETFLFYAAQNRRCDVIYKRAFQKKTQDVAAPCAID
jgi:hypothetical protein